MGVGGGGEKKRVWGGVYGRGGRWHRLEECDDGNEAGGDGCSRACLVEPGYACAGIVPDVCTPLAGPAAAAAIPPQGLLEVTPLGSCAGDGNTGDSSAPAFGWASFVAVAADGGRTPDAAMPAPGAGLPAVYRLGRPAANDATGTGGGGCGAAAAGDGFVCPCGGAGGIPPGRVWAEAGAVEEAAGVVPRDGATCVWVFPYSPFLKVVSPMLPLCRELPAAAAYERLTCTCDACATPPLPPPSDNLLPGSRTPTHFRTSFSPLGPRNPSYPNHPLPIPRTAQPPTAPA